MITKIVLEIDLVVKTNAKIYHKLNFVCFWTAIKQIN